MLAAIVIGSLVSATAVAGVGIDGVRLSDQPEAWFESQGIINGERPVFVFIEFASNEHEPFYFSGECFVALAATGSEVGRVRVGSTRLDDGVDRLRSPAFKVAWPPTAVTITCVPDYDPDLSFTAALEPWQYSPDHGTPGPRRAPPLQMPDEDATPMLEAITVTEVDLDAAESADSSTQ